MYYKRCNGVTAQWRNGETVIYIDSPFEGGQGDVNL